MQIKNLLSKMIGLVKRDMLVVLFVLTHSLLAVFLGRLYALAPDEG